MWETLEQTTFATSRSLRPHSSVFVAKNMHDAATSCARCQPKRATRAWGRPDLPVVVFHRVPHVEAVKPRRRGVHGGRGPVERTLATVPFGDG